VHLDIPVDSISVGIEWRIFPAGYPDIHVEYPDVPTE
jgi:hypothetical protein